MADEQPAAAADPAGSPAAAASPRSPAASQPNTVVVTTIDPVIQLPQLEEIFSAIGQLSSIRWFDAPASKDRVCLLEYGDEAQASSALIISDMHIVLGSKEIAVRRWDSWWQQQQEAVAKQRGREQQQAASAAAALATATAAQSASPASATIPGAVSLSDPLSIASAALAAAQLAQSLSQTAASYQPASAFDPNLTTIYVGNLAPPVTEEMLNAYFSQVGPLTAVRLQADGTSPNRFAFVEFLEVEKANAALALHGQQLLNRPMKVGKASTPITNRALLGVTTAGGPVFSEAERVARMQLAGNVTGEKVAAALARVAQAQQLIASKFGVPVQAPGIAALPLATAAVATTTLPASSSEARKGKSAERKRSSSRSRSRSRSSGHRRRRRSTSHSRSRSPSISRSRSPSHSRSRSRSPVHRQRRVRRWSRERDRDRGRGRRGDKRRSGELFGDERRDRRHGRRRSHSRSPPLPERRASAELEKKDEDMDVGNDRWRAGTDADSAANVELKKPKHTADERKEETHEADRGREKDKERQSERDREPYRDERRRDRSRSRERYGGGRDAHHRSAHHAKRRHSSDSGDEEIVHRRARDNAGQRNRYRKNGAGKEGLQWDGYQWVSSNIAVSTAVDSHPPRDDF